MTSDTREDTSTYPTRWQALAGIALAQLLTALDATVVNIAMPTAQSDLGFTDAQRPWVVTAYTVCFAGLLLTGGRIADRIGRRRAFLAALAGFAAASAVAGAAPTFEILLLGRALQGACAAVLAPTALSLVAVLFTNPQERRRAFATYGAVAGSGAVVGLIVGGALSQLIDWRWSLYVNVVFCAVAFVIGWRSLPDLPRFGEAPVQLGPALMATAGLGSVVYGASAAGEADGSRASALLWVFAGVAAVVAFLVTQQRSTNPMLPLRLFDDRNRLVAYLVVAMGVTGSFGAFLSLTYYFQAVLGWGPLRAGLAFLPLSVTVIASSFLVARRLGVRLSPRWMMAGGLVCAAGGLGWLATLTPHSGYLTTVTPSMVLLGAGAGLLFTPAITTVTAGVAPHDAGIAAAVANTAMQVGSSLGVTLINTVAVTVTRSAVRTGEPPVEALVDGYTTALAWCAAVTAAVAVVCVALLRPTSGKPQ